MAKKKDFIQYVESGMDIVADAINKGMKVLKADGYILDNYIIVWNSNERFGRLKNRKYLIVDENAITNYESNHKIIFTDDDSLVKDYQEILEYSEICEFNNYLNIA